MKKITLTANNTFEHEWINGLHNIPINAIEVTDSVFMVLSQDKSKKYDPATEIVSDYVAPFDLSAAQVIKHNDIRAAFETAAQQHITDANSIIWNGGYDSAVRMDAAKRMAEMAGQTSVVFFDISNAPQPLTIAEAEAVILLIGADYQTKYTNKQTLMTQVDALISTSTQADLDAITVTF